VTYALRVRCSTN